ncbi:Protein ripply3 [Camelus dromedarius]|uniref:Protein ripply3 n=1 Tax=Camelus dromedarius TaxID=9838 RepID=A0A5N4EL38_CAMDR|nr:protein ripply3 isoform X1 [Camelus dromedarius]KAB1284060.1 Protein ripply3 [Camelus dromedarius]
MRSEAAAGAREARGRVCDCPGDGPREPLPPRGSESQAPWRPWILTPQDAEPTGTRGALEPGGDQRTFGSKGAFGFQHPVRLYLPISKRQEYLQSSGEKVLASFPVQATIHFYNDESDSDGEQEEETLEVEEGKRRDPLTNAGWRPGGHGGLHGDGLLPLRDSPEDAGCSSSE